MSEEKPSLDEEEVEPGFLSRWSRRKQQASEHPLAAEIRSESAQLEEAAPSQPTDADMPPIESLTEASDYSGFFSPKVTEQLRQQALQKLFRSACFNVCDGLDDYAEDFTHFEKLGDVITADLKFRMQQEAEKLKQQMAETDKTEAETLQQAVRDNAAVDQPDVEKQQAKTVEDGDETEVSV
jgi:hypothetical protein